jgi:AAA domain-containing protein
VVATGPVVLDEAQSWPDVFPRLRAAIDAHRKRTGRFLLLGSVSPSLMWDVAESLAGRLSIVELTPFLTVETQPKRTSSGPATRRRSTSSSNAAASSGRSRSSSPRPRASRTSSDSRRRRTSSALGGVCSFHGFRNRASTASGSPARSSTSWVCSSGRREGTRPGDPRQGTSRSTVLTSPPATSTTPASTGSLFSTGSRAFCWSHGARGSSYRAIASR